VIFVTVGTHEQPFNRLVKEIDRLKENKTINEDVFIQTGYSDYKPEFCMYSEFIKYSEMQEMVERARIVVTHGGPASIILVLSRGKVPLIVPRQKEHGEHVDDHQVRFCQKLEEKARIIAVYRIEDIAYKIKNYDTLTKDLKFREVEEEDPQKKVRKFARSLDEICLSLTRHIQKK